MPCKDLLYIVHIEIERNVYHAFDIGQPPFGGASFNNSFISQGLLQIPPTSDVTNGAATTTYVQYLQ